MLNCSVRHDDTQHVVVPFDLLVMADYHDARSQTNASWVVETGGAWGGGRTLRIEEGSEGLMGQGANMPTVRGTVFACPPKFFLSLYSNLPFGFCSSDLLAAGLFSMATPTQRSDRKASSAKWVQLSQGIFRSICV